MSLPVHDIASISPSPVDSEFLSKRSKIRFPAQPSVHVPPTTSPPAYLPSESPQKLSLSDRTPSGLTSSPLSFQNTGATLMSQRRRVSSVDTADVFVESPRPQRKFMAGVLTPPRGIDAITSKVFESAREENLSADHFSDEYDLSHEDPRILQDVQRALKLKARREARLGSKSPVHPSQRSPLRSTRHMSLSPQPTSSPGKTSISSDLDFGPSIGAFAAHPVPASLDNGATLDWSGCGPRTDGRWKISTTKRKGKEPLPPSSLLVDHQETAHADKIARLKTIISPDTLKKARMIREQLDRRYRIINDSVSDGTPFNPAQVARWYSSQGSLIQASLEKAEPFIWLKHLDRRRGKHPNRARWYLSSLIIEEYFHAHNHGTKLQQLLIPPVAAPDSPSPYPLHSPSSSRGSSNHVLGPSLARTSSFEGVTFQPILEVEDASLETGSQRSAASSFSSLPSGLPHTSPHTPPPKSERDSRSPDPILRSPKLGPDRTRRTDIYSLSDHSDGRAMLSSPEPDIRITVASDLSGDERPSWVGITLQVTAPTPASASATNPPQPLALSVSQRTDVVERVINRRRVRRTSLPSSNRTYKAREIQLQKEASEEKAYQVKAKLLEETLTHNHRIRQLLNRISGALREYDTSQINAMPSLGLMHGALPRELIDAFGHDPAAVTGATRRFRGWRAVDDIQHRLLRQREVLETFLANPENDISISQSVLDNPIASLVECLDALESHRHKITRRAAHVVETLKSVQNAHATVKKEYKDTLAHTSVVYPELTHIVALEESYKDQYQQIWEFGMDTLTFLLDTVTPFWRTYGTTIGQDMQDFLIVPLYRNEFTGEPKRYPIKAVPARSYRHWLGLLLFSFLSVSVNILQVRAAISSAVNYKLSMIPYESIRWTALPFFWISIFIQWWAVIVEFFVVLMQVGILVWWFGWSVGIFT